MSTGRDDDQTWADLVDAFHTEPDPQEDAQRWPAAENIDPDDDHPLYDPPDGLSPLYGDQPPDEAPDDEPADDEPPDDGPPDGDTLDPYPGASRTLGELSAGLAGIGPVGPRRPGETNVTDDDHFVPPNPPPIPRGDRITRWAWTGLIGAPSILLVSSVMGWSPPTEFLALLVGGFIAGFATLIARMRGRNPHDPDNGAVV